VHELVSGDEALSIKWSNLAPLRSAIGMMEQWNDGIMGSGILEWWI